jgi:translation initiation factor 2B subunit (eIF-2B alpha/beta/delta family)
MADGGATFSAGHLMVAIAANEHHVPVVGLAATFLLTPMFAHNNSESLGQLLSPSLCIPYVYTSIVVDVTFRVLIMDIALY